MKILKILLFIVLGIIGILLILGLVGPKTFEVHRTTVIPASPDQVWPHVSSLQNMGKWSPWAKRDTAMEIELTGTDGTVGATQKWNSKKMGKGQQSITAIDPGKSVETELKFYMPWGVSTSTGYTQLQDTSGQTKITWGIKGENDFISKIFAVFMNFDKAMGKDFEEGLENLKTLVATAPAASSADVKITPGEYPGGQYLGVRATITMDKIESFYSENLGKVFGELQKAGMEITGMPTGLYYTWDMEKNTTDMAAAVGFKGELKKAPEGMNVLNVPASKSLTIDYLGGYSGLGNAHNAMDAYIKANNLTSTLR